MASPVKDGKTWRHRVRVDGRRAFGTFDTKAVALAWEAEQRTAKPDGNATTQTCKGAIELRHRHQRHAGRFQMRRVFAVTATVRHGDIASLLLALAR